MKNKTKEELLERVVELHGKKLANQITKEELLEYVEIHKELSIRGYAVAFEVQEIE